MSKSWAISISLYCEISPVIRIVYLSDLSDFSLKNSRLFFVFFILAICVSGWHAIKKINKNIANLFKLWYNSNIDKMLIRQVNPQATMGEDEDIQNHMHIRHNDNQNWRD